MRLLLSLLMLATFLNASIIIDKGLEKIDNFEMLYYNDTSGSLSINDISKLDFNQTVSNRFTKSMVKGNSWFKFTVTNNSNNEDFLLNLNEIFMDKVNLYTMENGSIIKKKNGLNISMIDKEIRDPSPTFNLHIKKRDSKDFYIETHTKQNTLGKFTLYLNKDSYINDKIISIGVNIFYLGGAFIVILLNFFLFTTLKERIYLYYSSYVLVLSIYMAVLSGIVEYIIPDSFYLLEFTAPLSIFLLILFSIEILQTSIYTPRLHKILIFFSIIDLIFTILIAIDANTWYILFLNIMPLIAFFIFFTSIVALKNGSNDAKFYIMFMLLYVVSLVIIIIMSMGLVEYNNFTRYSFNVSAFLEISFFSLVLANRFNSTKKEKLLVETALKDTEELSNRDGLTNLHNRRYLEAHSTNYFNEAIANKQTLCVMMLDIDKFKLVNDNYGHGVGDIVLSSVADIFTTITRESDIVVRYGGEEFIIILPNTSLENTQAVAEKIRAKIEETKMKYEDDKELLVTISLGISLLNSEDTDIESIITRADKALYESKNTGRNRVSIIKK